MKPRRLRKSIPLFRLLGIPIGLDYSWFLIFALLTWVLASSYFPAEFSNWPTSRYWDKQDSNARGSGFTTAINYSIRSSGTLRLFLIGWHCGSVSPSTAARDCRMSV